MSVRQDGLHISQRTVENLGDRIGMFLYAKIPTQIKTQTDTIKNDANHEKGVWRGGPVQKIMHVTGNTFIQIKDFTHREI